MINGPGLGLGLWPGFRLRVMVWAKPYCYVPGLGLGAWLMIWA